MSFKEFVDGSVTGFVDGTIVPFLYALAFLFFIYGIARTFFSDNDEKRKEGRAFAIWSVIGLAVLASVWGLVKVLLSVLHGGV